MALTLLQRSHRAAKCEEVKWTNVHDSFPPSLSLSAFFNCSGLAQPQVRRAPPTGGGLTGNYDKKFVVVAPQASSAHAGVGAAQCGQSWSAVVEGPDPFGRW